VKRKRTGRLSIATPDRRGRASDLRPLLTVFRSNRGRIPCSVLAAATASSIPPGPWEKRCKVVVNTWAHQSLAGRDSWPLNWATSPPTLRFPFPAATSARSSPSCFGRRSRRGRSRRCHQRWSGPAGAPARTGGKRQRRSCWPAGSKGRSDRQAFDGRSGKLVGRLPDSFDDLSLYRPDLESAWLAGLDHGRPRRCLPPPAGLAALLLPPPP